MGAQTWTLPADLAVGHIVTAAEWQSYVTNNLLALQAYQAKTTTKDVNTTGSATDLFNAEFTIPANTMGTKGLIACYAWGDWLNNSGSTLTIPRFQVLLGGATLLDTGAAGGIGSGATRMAWRMMIEIANRGATNSQTASIQVMLTNQTSNFTTGQGGAAATMLNTQGNTAGSPGTVDTTSAQPFVLNVINPSASASYSTRLFGSYWKGFPS